MQGVKTLRLESADGFELLFIKDLFQVDVAGQKTIDIGSVNMKQVQHVALLDGIDLACVQLCYLLL